MGNPRTGKLFDWEVQKNKIGVRVGPADDVLLRPCELMDNFGSSLGLIGSQEGFNSKAAWVLCTD